MSPISAISGTEFTTEGRTLLDDVDQFFKTVGGQVYNSRLGDINLTRRGVKDSLAHGMTPQKAAAFAAIPDVLRKGKVVGFEKNWKGRGYDTATIEAQITIDGEEYLMAVVVHRSNSTNRFYVHDVFIAKKEATPFMTGTQNLGEPGGATPTISIIRRIMDVKRKKRVNSGTQYALSPADSDRRTLSDKQQKADGEFVYIIEMTENNEIEPSSPQDSQNSGRNGVPNSSNNIVQNDGEDVNPRFSLSPADDSGKELTQEQQDFFRAAKAVTRDGRVMPL